MYDKLKVDFPEQVEIGELERKNASPQYWQVYGANAKNWDLKDKQLGLTGDGQAGGLCKK